MADLQGIKVINLSTDKVENSYQTEIRWTTDPSSFSGDITITVKDNGTALQKTYTTKNTNRYLLNDSDITWDTNHTYSIVLSANNGNISSQEERLLLASYSITSGEYDGKSYSVILQAESEAIEQGLAVLTTKNHNISTGFKRQLRFSLDAPAFVWQEDEDGTLVIIPYANAYIAGPPLEVQVPVQGIRLVSVNSVQENDNGFSIIAVYQGSSSLTKTAYLKMNGCKIKEAKTVKEQGNNTIKLDFDKEDKYFAAMLPGCELVLQTVCGNIKTSFEDETNSMPLANVKTIQLDWSKKAGMLSWLDCFWSNQKLYKVVVTDNNATTNYFTNDTFLKFTAAQLPDSASLQIFPYYGGRCGLPSDSYAVYQPGFYLRKDTDNNNLLSLDFGSTEEQQVYWLFEEEMFPSFKNAVEKEGFCLQKITAGYLFSIDYTKKTDVNTYQEFLALVCADANQIYPKAFYNFLDSVGRICKIKLTDHLLFAFGFDGEKGYIDLRPGMTLCVDTQHYELGGTDGSVACGYLFAGQEQYSLCVTGNDAKSRLSFEPFLDLMTQNVNITASGLESGGIGGLLDLFSKDVMYAYFRLQYPEEIEQPSHTVPANYSKRPVLIGSVDYASLLQMSDRYMHKQDIMTNYDGGNAVYYRGRVAMTVKIKVYVFGKCREIPLGTTLSQLLLMESIYETSAIRLYRSVGCASRVDASGNKLSMPDGMLPIYIQKMDEAIWESLVLYAGDCIERK